MAVAAARRPSRLAPAAVAGVALLTRALTIGRFQTTDEVNWMRRSDQFAHALASFDLDSLTASTDEVASMPGVTTLWLGSLARTVWTGGRAVGLWSEPSREFRRDMAGLTLAQLMAAIATALLVGLTVWLLQRWANTLTAVVAGVLLATEPFWVAHGSIIHTDELSALFGLTGMLALALVVGVPEAHPRFLGRRGLAVGAGVLLACSPLTKISGLGFAPSAAFVVGWAAVVAARRRVSGSSVTAALRPLARTTGWLAIGAVASVVVLWPALWADPSTQIGLLRDSAALGSTGHQTFFMGEVIETPGPLFYLVALPLRMTPWMFLGVIVGVPLALARRRSRARALVMLAAAAPLAVNLTLAAKQFDRYGLLVLGPLVVVVALAFTPREREAAEMTPRTRLAVIGAVGLIALHSASVAPWGLAYYNPVLGGSETATENVLVGWEEGLHQASDRIGELEHGDCRGVTVNGLNIFMADIFRCAVWSPDPKTATYVVQYINDTQRNPEELAAQVAGRELVSTVEVRGIPYVTIWR